MVCINSQRPVQISMCQVYGLLIYLCCITYDLLWLICYLIYLLITVFILFQLSHSILLGDFGDENVEVVQSVANVEFSKAVILGNHDAWFTKQFSRRWSLQVCSWNHSLCVCVLCEKRFMLFDYSIRLNENFILEIYRKLGK